MAQTTNATAPDVPKGEVLNFGFADSKIFPGPYRWILAALTGDARRQNMFGRLGSLSLLIVLGDTIAFTAVDCAM